MSQAFSHDFDCRKAGFRMPAEWEKQQTTWLGWPVLENREQLWGDNYEKVCEAFSVVAQTIAKYQKCRVMAHSKLAEKARLLCGPTVEVIATKNADDNWLRDSGPIFLNSLDNTKQIAAKFVFNCWGEKYQPYDGSRVIGEEIIQLAGVEVVHSPMVLEGGSFFVDGQGTLLTTESCLLNKNRNPHMSKSELEQELRRMLGVEKIIWLPGDYEEVETDGHVDLIASFIAPGKILLNTADSDMGEAYRCMQENRRALELATDANGRRFELLDLKMPRTDLTLDSRRRDAIDCDTYANYILINGALVSTRFGVIEDEKAIATFQQAFPSRSIELIDIRAIGSGGGSVHCSTQQQPSIESR